MKATNHGNGEYVVEVDGQEVDAFRRGWPGNLIGDGRSFAFYFDCLNGDLTDVAHFIDGRSVCVSDEDYGGAALAALSEDAGRFGAEVLELEDVLAIRYGGGPRP